MEDENMVLPQKKIINILIKIFKKFDLQKHPQFL